MMGAVLVENDDTGGRYWYQDLLHVADTDDEHHATNFINDPELFHDLLIVGEFAQHVCYKHIDVEPGLGILY